MGNIYGQFARMNIFKRLELLQELYLHVAYNGWGTSDDEVKVVGNDPAGLEVKDEAVYKALRRLERDLWATMGIYSRKIVSLAPGEPKRVKLNEPMGD